MNTEYSYTLDKGSTKHICPSCGKKRFVRYVDTQTGEYLPNHYGRCDREANCGYNANPYTGGYHKEVWKSENRKPTPNHYHKPKPKPKPKPLIPFPYEVYKQYLVGHESNVFIRNLRTRVNFPFDVIDVEKVIAQYYLGTVQNGATTFPFIDIDGVIRAVQVKQFDENSHTTSTNFMHSIIKVGYDRIGDITPDWLKSYLKNDKKVTCLFGEHLLRKYPYNPIALVEAPKTAVYGTLYFGFPNNPNNYLWLAVYNLSSLNHEKCKALKGRDVYLFPDLSQGGRAHKLWKDKAANISKQMGNTTFRVSDLLERLAPSQDREKGSDIADYLIKLDWRRFRPNDQAEIKELRKAFQGVIITDETARDYVDRTLYKTSYVPSYDIGILKALLRHWKKPL